MNKTLKFPTFFKCTFLFLFSVMAYVDDSHSAMHTVKNLQSEQEKNSYNYERLLSFPGIDANPTESLVKDSYGNLYGTTTTGGKYNAGTIFKVKPDGTEVVLFSFGRRPQDGRKPHGALILGAYDCLYGTTSEGGDWGKGTVFQISTGSGELNILHSFFGGRNDGAYPYASLTQGADGYLYGTTSEGGIWGKGTVYKISVRGAGKMILHSFGYNTQQGKGSIAEGMTPLAPLLQGEDGNFYGTTSEGGLNNNGTVFKLTPDGNETVLYSFKGNNSLDAMHPVTGLIQDEEGSLYGTTYEGGKYNQGTVFKITNSNTENVLYSFGKSPQDERHPNAALMMAADGNLYGTTTDGGQNGQGAIFRMNKKGDESILYSFGSASSGDAGSPYASLIQDSDTHVFYGTTFGGGKYGRGTVFKLSETGVESVLFSFEGTSSAAVFPASALIQASNGNFYGTTILGGVYNHGTVYKLSPDGEKTILYSFGANGADDGSYPLASLVQASDGNLYGTTSEGGAFGLGSVFKITTEGAETVLHSFQNGVAFDGAAPVASLIEGSDGNLYGTTSEGGTNDTGVVFKITTAGAESVLHSFGEWYSCKDATHPLAALVQASDGNLYGTGFSGGTQNRGAVFKITMSGEETVLYSFYGVDPRGFTDADSPAAPLIQGSDGNLYGTTTDNAGDGLGSLFKITLTGKESVIHRFGENYRYADGVHPVASVIQGSDGYLYGTTKFGGLYHFGTVFRFLPDGSTPIFEKTTLYSFGNDGFDGSQPTASLIQGIDGHLYGTTIRGGLNDTGTVFRMVVDRGNQVKINSLNANDSAMGSRTPPVDSTKQDKAHSAEQYLQVPQLYKGLERFMHLSNGPLS